MAEMARHTTALVSAVACVVVVACGGADRTEVRTQAVAPAVASSDVRDCRSRVEGGTIEPSRYVDAVVGPVTFGGLGLAHIPDQEVTFSPARLRKLLRSRAGREWPKGERRFVEAAISSGRSLHPGLKTLVLVEAGAVATVAIAPHDRRHASLLYGEYPRRHGFLFDVKDGASAVSFHACPGFLPAREARRVCGWKPYKACLGESTQFNGGFVVDGPRCFTLEVWPRGERRPLRRRIGFGVSC